MKSWHYKELEKVFLYTNLLLFITLLISCTNPNANGSEVEEINLRSTADSISKNTEWTTELEADRLNTVVKGADGIEQSLVASPQNIFASGNEKQYQPIYPSINGFGTLDTSKFDSGSLSTLNGFCTALTMQSDVDSYFIQQNLYTLILFLYDIKQEKKNIFSSYVLGEPFKGDDGTFECPVRFYFKEDDSEEKIEKGKNGSHEKKLKTSIEKKQGTAYDSSLDVYLYLVQEENTWKINQIEYKQNQE